MAKSGGGPIVDFTGIQSGGGRPRIPEGDHLAKCVSVKQEISSKGNEMLVWRFEVVSSDRKANGKVLQTYTSLVPDALWKLRGLLEAMGQNVPDGRAQLRLKGYIGKEIGLTVIDEEYNNRMYSSISDFVSPLNLDEEDEAEDEDEEDEEEDEDEEETPAPKAKKSKKSKRSESDEQIEDIDLDEL
jgi:hypothetical protein